MTKITSPGGLLRSTGRFLTNFGAPRRSQNGLKWTSHFGKNHFRSLREPLWDNFGSPIPFFLHSGSIFESFYDPLGSILDPLWNNFSTSSTCKPAKQHDSKNAKTASNNLARRNARSALNNLTPKTKSLFPQI